MPLSLFHVCTPETALKLIGQTIVTACWLATSYLEYRFRPALAANALATAAFWSYGFYTAATISVLICLGASVVLQGVPTATALLLASLQLGALPSTSHLVQRSLLLVFSICLLLQDEFTPKSLLIFLLPILPSLGALTFLLLHLPSVFLNSFSLGPILHKSTMLYTANLCGLMFFIMSQAVDRARKEPRTPPDAAAATSALASAPAAALASAHAG